MKLSKLNRCWILGGLCAASVVAQAATTAQIDAMRAKGLQWLVSHQNSEGYWPAPVGLELAAATEAMQAYANAGMKGMPYGRVSSWVGVAQANSVDSLARKIAALQKGGNDVSALSAQLVSWRTGTSFMKSNSLNSGWGAYDHFEVSHPDTALALGALRQAAYSGYGAADGSGNRVSALCGMVQSQQADGSWNYAYPAGTGVITLSSAGAIVPTVQNILELTVVNKTYTGFTCGGVSYTLSTALNTAANWLITNKKQADGGFGDGTSSAMDTAQVYRALVAINSVDAAQVGAKTAALDYLVSHQAADGSWGADAFSTALVLAGLPAAALIDADRDGVPDVVEALLGGNAAVAGRGLFGGGALAPVKALPVPPPLPAPLPRSYSVPPPVSASTFITLLPMILDVLLD